jgi:hypothetical protein
MNGSSTIAPRAIKQHGCSLRRTTTSTPRPARLETKEPVNRMPQTVAKFDSFSLSLALKTDTHKRNVGQLNLQDAWQAVCLLHVSSATVDVRSGMACEHLSNPASRNDL